MSNHDGATSGSNQEMTSSRWMKNPSLGWNEFMCFLVFTPSPIKSVDMIWMCACLPERPNPVSTHGAKTRAEASEA